MTLLNLIVFIEGDEVLHVHNREQSLWIGKAINAIAEISNDVLCSKIKNVHTGFSGLCVEIW